MQIISRREALTRRQQLGLLREFRDQCLRASESMLQDELAGKQGPALPELAVVQDADRLDAIGAVGIARCFTFGGKFGRVLHDPGVAPRTNLTAEEYKSGEATTLNHFYEKLLKLKVQLGAFAASVAWPWSFTSQLHDPESCSIPPLALAGFVPQIL